MRHCLEYNVFGKTMAIKYHSGFDNFFKRSPRHEGVSGEWKYSSIHSLTSALDGDERSASRPGRFTLKERGSDTHWIGGWVGPRAVLDAVADYFI
jgi:hypothetical protein